MVLLSHWKTTLFLLSYLSCGQTWLNLPMAKCQCDYITKLGKRTLMGTPQVEFFSVFLSILFSTFFNEFLLLINSVFFLPKILHSATRKQGLQRLHILRVGNPKHLPECN
jgi:hypothetical protein